MKRVSFKVAKAIKEAGFPQEGKVYYDAFGNLADYKTKIGIEFFERPTYMELWLWLWREKGIKLQNGFNSVYIWPMGVSIGDYEDPEEAIISAIEHLVDNDLIK